MEKPPSLNGAVSPALSLQSENRATLRKEMTFPVYIKDPNPNPVTEPESDPNELSIFDAQKYFNGSVVTIQKPNRRFGTGFGLDKIPERDCLRISSASSIETFGVRHVMQATTTSEASWNSQAGFLTKPPDAVPAPVSKPPIWVKWQGAVKWLLGRKCPCYGRSSILVEEYLEDVKPNYVPPHPRRVIPDAPMRDTFSVPQQKVIQRAPPNQRETPRKSLEVFQPGHSREEDIASDASSDLFEIESFSTQSNFHNLEEGRRVGSCIEASSVYEPSEVSIDWSVVTASASAHFLVTESEIMPGEDEKRCDCGKVRIFRWGMEDGRPDEMPAIASLKALPSNSTPISIPRISICPPLRYEP